MIHLKRTLGLGSLIFYGVGTIIGAGIYSIIGAAAAKAGTGLWQSFLLASIVAALTGLSYAELASAFPRAGAEYIYIRKVFPKRKWAAFTTGFILIVAAAATATTVSFAFAGYFNVFVNAPLWIVAFALLAICTAINIIGIKESSTVNILFTIIEILGLALVIYFGASSERFGEALTAIPHMGVLSATSIIFFVYLGFNDLANLSEEANQPEKNVPRAILWSLGITTVLYVAVALSALALAYPEEFANSDSPLASVLAQRSPFWARGLGAIALFSTANTALINLIVASRLTYSMTREGDLPSFLGRISKSRKTPWVAAFVVFALSAIFLPLGKVDAMGSFASFVSLLAFAAVNFSLFVLRRAHPHARHAFRTPWTIGRYAVVPLLGLMSIAILITQFQAKIYFIGAVAIGLGLATYALKKKNP